MRHCDVVIFLELFNPIFLRFAGASVGVFNLEWFPNRWRRYLPGFTQLWAKSREAYDVYRALGLTTATYTGFLARDLYDPAVTRELRVLHLQGHSKLKNTDAVLDAWRRYPDLPPLTIITMQNVPYPPPGVTVLSRVDQVRLVTELNRHQIHLCPSRAEGWGHYIVEGMACEATVVTTDASPMSEHVQPGRGFLIPATPADSGGYLGAFHAVDPGDVEDGIWRAASLSGRERAEVGKLAREHALTRNEQFAATVQANLGSL